MKETFRDLNVYRIHLDLSYKLMFFYNAYLLFKLFV